MLLLHHAGLVQECFESKCGMGGGGWMLWVLIRGCVLLIFWAFRVGADIKVGVYSNKYGKL